MEKKLAIYQYETWQFSTEHLARSRGTLACRCTAVEKHWCSGVDCPVEENNEVFLEKTKFLKS